MKAIEFHEDLSLIVRSLGHATASTGLLMAYEDVVVHDQDITRILADVDIAKDKLNRIRRQIEEGGSR